MAPQISQLLAVWEIFTHNNVVLAPITF